MYLVTLLQLAGILHVGLISAGALMPGVVDLRRHLAVLPEFIRRLVWVYYTFIGVSLVAFGSITFFGAHELASGSPLARAFAGFLCVFWTARLGVATFVFDLRPYLTNRWRWLGYQATNMVFAALPLIYGWTALRGGVA